MNEQAKKEMLKVWKSGMEAYMKMTTSVQEQGDKLLDLMLQQSEVIEDESRKLMREWVSNAKEIQKGYMESLQENIKKIEEML